MGLKFNQLKENLPIAIRLESKTFEIGFINKINKIYFAITILTQRHWKIIPTIKDIEDLHYSNITNQTKIVKKEDINKIQLQPIDKELLKKVLEISKKLILDKINPFYEEMKVYNKLIYKFK